MQLKNFGVDGWTGVLGRVTAEEEVCTGGRGCRGRRSTDGEDTGRAVDRGELRRHGGEEIIFSSTPATPGGG